MVRQLVLAPRLTEKCSAKSRLITPADIRVATRSYNHRGVPGALFSRPP